MKLFGALGVVIQAKFCRGVGRLCVDPCRGVVIGFSDVTEGGVLSNPEQLSGLAEAQECVGDQECEDGPKVGDNVSHPDSALPAMDSS